MRPRTPTDEQRAAIETDARTVLVEAGAGTGKTGVMVERYCRLLCEEGASPDAVLAFTFTDKAATELRERIRLALIDLAARGSERAGELLPVLGGAWVTTMHGFCNRLLAGHPVAVGIDPRFRVLDAPEAERAATEAFEETLERFLADADPARERTVAAFGIDGLRSAVTSVHAELRSRGTAEPRLPEAPPVDVAAALRRAAEAAGTTLPELSETDRNRPALERAAELLGGELDDEPDLDTVCSLRTGSSAKAMTGYEEAIDQAVRRTAEAGEGGLSYGHLRELLRLFGERFAEVKERRAGLDFEDLQLLAVELLERDGGSRFRDRFSHVLVDEFQDTNRLQLRLIKALRGESAKLMVVGDELQSIYGFRHADLEVFREQRQEIESAADGEAIALSGNFRSRPEVIGAVNAVGEALLGERHHPLRVGLEPQPESSEEPLVELLLTGRDGWDEEGIELDPARDARSPLNVLAEARFLASRLRELADSGVERGGMVVLLRAFTHLDAYEESLERAGLRPYVVGGRGYWSQQQVADVCALLLTIANPLDDGSLFGALASPACGAGPDTLWLLRAATGERRHVWPTVERLSGLGEAEPEAPERLEEIPAPEQALLRRFAETISGLRRRAPLLPLSELVEAAVTETGYDLAVLMRPAGEARFANVRKLMRLAADYEASEGRDLRGLLDYLAARREADSDAQAATAVEGHDGVRIMTVHSAKGLEFDVVAVAQLSRPPLTTRMPALLVGHEADSPRFGLHLRRLGAGALRLFSHRELWKEAQEREAEEELRLFHVAMTRARGRLILSGVMAPEPGNGSTLRTTIVERLATAFGVDRERDSTIAVPAPEASSDLPRSFGSSELAVRVSLPSPERAEQLRARHSEPAEPSEVGASPAPLLERRPPRPPRRPLSYTALAGDDEERAHTAPAGDRGAGAAAAHGVAVHGLLEWSHANGWQLPPPEVVERFALAAGVERGSLEPEALLAPLRAWRESAFFAERVRPALRCRAEVPILLQLDGTVVRGSIDLLVENEGEPPLIVDYKTDRLGGADPAERAERYGLQRAIYAAAVAEARRVGEVELAYVFLERPQEPVSAHLSGTEIESGRAEVVAAITARATG